MPEDWDPSEAIVICTRNRPGELRHTLAGIEDHPPSGDAALVVVDASDPEARTENRNTVDSVQAIPGVHWPYTDTPSSAQQRNAALDRLPRSVEVVHFIDDDVTVHPGYFEALAKMLRTAPEVGGVGGCIREPERPSSSPQRTRLRRLFGLAHPEPGRVLRSGIATQAQHPTPDASSSVRETEWLSSCASSYRRALLDRHRFDSTLTGYAMLEDLDLSYRIHQDARLVVVPTACLTHRRSARNRLDAERYSRALTVHRRWFVEKHFGEARARSAYWWSQVGRLLALLASSSPTRTAALRGLLRGLGTVLRRDHPLLRP
jgi:GT2 family glycosyltransferase